MSHSTHIDNFGDGSPGNHLHCY